jgi:SAM-dependent methyltransferase
MGEVHEVAAVGFGAVAQEYDRARPSYPAEAVAWLATALRIEPGRHVVDLAAGTGKLTAMIVDRGAALVAVEPVRAMREQLRKRLPAIPLLAATAESLPFADGCLDAVTVAQAFHWFDRQRAMAELARVLRPGGRLGLIWNARDRSVDWVNQVWSVLDQVERQAPWRDHRDGTGGPAGALRWSEYGLIGQDGWSGFVEATFRHHQPVTHDNVVERMHSVSHVAVLPPAEQTAVLGEIRAILRDHPDTRDNAILAIPYRTDAMYTEWLA